MRGNSTINLLETKQFISAVKGRVGDGGRGCGVKRDPAGETGTKTNKDKQGKRNIAERITKLIRLHFHSIFGFVIDVFVNENC